MARRVHVNFNDQSQSHSQSHDKNNFISEGVDQNSNNYEYYANYSNQENYQYQPDFQSQSNPVVENTFNNNYDYSYAKANTHASMNNQNNANYYENANYHVESIAITKTSFPVVQPPPLVQNSDPNTGFNSQYSSYANHADKSWIKAFSSGGFENESPLLEELGINFSHIKAKTLASLNPFRKLDSGTLQDADLAGPLLFCFLFGMSLLLSGKVHFGYIYGVATLGWISIFVILNLMTENGVSFYLTASVLGYCLLPMVLLSAVAVLLKLRGVIGIVLGITSVSWCTFSSSTFFVSAFGMHNQQILISYPIFLLYSCFALMTIF